MAALNLHHAIFANEKNSRLPLRSASPFLHPASGRDGSPTSQFYSSAVYQDLIQRQPTHPDGPTFGWDLGLNLFGDPITEAECKSIEGHQTKMKLRRLRAINIACELLFGIWGTYATVRYVLALAHGPGATHHVCTLVLGITSALAVVLVTMSVLLPLFPRRSRPRTWRYTRYLLRASYLLLLYAGAVMNLVLVLVWHPAQLCHWDVDLSWYTSTTNTSASPCRAASFPAWIIAAVVRVVLTLTVALSFIYTLRSYHKTRHPSLEGNTSKYSPYSPSDPEDASAISTSSPLDPSKSTFRFTRSDDSNHTLNHSDVTFPKTNSIGTLAPSTSCAGRPRARSVDMTLPRISPPTSRRTSTHANSYGSSATQVGSETPSQTQSDDVTPASSGSPVLRRTSHVSLTQVASDTTSCDVAARSEWVSSPTVARDPHEIGSGAAWKSGHRGTGGRSRSSLAWEETHVRRASQTSASPTSSSSAHDEGESVKERDAEDVAYSYGYGASAPTYPYLDMYHPQRQQPDACAETSSCDDVDEHGFSRGYRRTIPSGGVMPDVCSEPRTSLSGEDEESSGEEEEYVAMMGGFVRRMATIESLGSKEAAGTLSTGSVALYSMRSGAVTPQPSCTSSVGGTAYLSFSSGGTGMRVNERGELLRGSHSAGGSSYDRPYYTASGRSLPTVDDEPR